MLIGCSMYLFGTTNDSSTNGYWVFYIGTYLAQPMVVLTNGYWVFYVPIWHNQWLLGVLFTCLAQPMVVHQWLLGVLCTCLVQPMVIRPMVVGCAMYLFGPTNGGSTNGFWVCYVPIWPNQWWFDQWFLGVLCPIWPNQ
jgi:hypothetical protein